MWSIYLENRDNISDEDAEEIIRTIVIASVIHGLAIGSDKNIPKGRLLNILWNDLNNAN